MIPMGSESDINVLDLARGSAGIAPIARESEGEPVGSCEVRSLLHSKGAPPAQAGAQVPAGEEKGTPSLLTVQKAPPSFQQAVQLVVVMNRIQKLQTLAPYSTWEAPRPAPQKFKARSFIVDKALYRITTLVPFLRRLRVLKGTMAWAARNTAQNPVTQFLDSLLRGMSQCVICNSPVTGLFLMGALFAAGTKSGENAHAAYVAVCGLLGILGSSAGALLLGVDANLLQTGLFGYNGLLTGLSTATFLAHDAWDPGVLSVSIVLGALTTFLQLALGNALISAFKTPPLTLPFHIVAVMFVLASYSFDQFEAASFIQPNLKVDHGSRGISAVEFKALFEASLTSVGQIVFCGSPLSGGLMLLGMVFYSRIAAIAAFCGAFIGCGFATALGADATAVLAGHYGYNAALSSIAAVTFFMPNRQAILMAVVACVLAVLNDGAWKAIAAPLGAPTGGWPFWNISILFLLQDKIPGFIPIPLAEVAAPEDHMMAPRTAKPNSQITEGDESPRREVIVLQKSPRMSRFKPRGGKVENKLPI